MVRIAFGCESRVGKDTACEYLQNKYGGKIIRLAKPLYKILFYLQSLCGLENHKDRVFLQILGTEWGRNEIKDSIWIDHFKDKCDQYGPEENIYCPDLRFQ